jgi:hypothetical protein
MSTNNYIEYGRITPYAYGRDNLTTEEQRAEVMRVLSDNGRFTRELHAYGDRINYFIKPHEVSIVKVWSEREFEWFAVVQNLRNDKTYIERVTFTAYRVGQLGYTVYSQSCKRSNFPETIRELVSHERGY